MKTDLYTKVVLTIIAICLVCIVTKDVSFVPEAQAVGFSERVDVNIVSVAGYNFNKADVDLSAPYLPVRVFK